MPRTKKQAMTEIGYSGLDISAGVSTAELDRALNFPLSLKTYKEMSSHPAVNAPLSLYNTMISKARIRVLPVKDASKKEIKQAELVETMLKDMKTNISDVMLDIMTMTQYGFSVLEKVYYIRKTDNGSDYNDGLVGIKKLALRSQRSITKFNFDEAGNEVLGVEQNVNTLNYGITGKLRFQNRLASTVTLPREKFMLFNIGRDVGNPFGESTLRDVYLPWKYLTTIEELEAAGVAKDLQGLPVLKVPAQYMSADASPEQKAIYEQFKNIIRNLQNNSQSGLILPSSVDPDTKTELFSVELLSTEGKKNYDTTVIKEYYRNMIFIGMNADILLMGNTQTGSFALGTLKSSLTGAFIESMLKRIMQVLNEDLVKQLYQLNGWDVTRRCTIDYEGFSDIDSESFSKLIQRIASVGYLPKTVEVINTVMQQLGLDPLPADTNLDKILPEDKSKAGEGMKTAGEGTSTSVSGRDTSSDNADNSA